MSKYIETHEELLKLHGRKVTCTIADEYIDDAKICIKDHKVYISNNICDGGHRHKLEYKGSWIISHPQNKYEEYNADCTEIQLVEEELSLEEKIKAIPKNVEKHSDFVRSCKYIVQENGNCFVVKCVNCPLSRNNNGIGENCTDNFRGTTSLKKTSAELWLKHNDTPEPVEENKLPADVIEKIKKLPNKEKYIESCKTLVNNEGKCAVIWCSNCPFYGDYLASSCVDEGYSSTGDVADTNAVLLESAKEYLKIHYKGYKEEKEDDPTIFKGSIIGKLPPYDLKTLKFLDPSDFPPVFSETVRRIANNNYGSLEEHEALLKNIYD